LNALYSGSGDDAGLTLFGTDSFIARPAQFSISVPSNPAATSAAGSVFKKAGEIFQVEVTARNASGTVTPNYGQEAVPETVQLSNSFIAPAGYHNPILAGCFNPFGINCSGNSVPGYACGQFSWNEVGIICLLPSVADGDYLGTGNVSGNLSTNVGRFIPDHFVPSIIDNGIFADACSGFTYSGQPFTYAIPHYPELLITAVGSGGNTVVNYRDDFVKLTQSSQINMPAVTADASQLGASGSRVSLTWTPAASTLVANNNGTLNFTLGADEFIYTRDTNALIPPFTSDVELVVTAITDSDGVSAGGMPV